MFDNCNFSKDDSVLIIGCLSGYSMALLSNMVNYIFGIENDKKLVDKANKTLSFLNCHNCSVFFRKDLSYGLSKNAPYDKIFIEGSVNFVPKDLVKQLKEDGEIFTVLENNNKSIGEFVRGIKIDSSLSFSSLFDTSVNLLADFIIEENDYEKNF
jgi:protein-L-isoaspartate(D-aspartate) O-methyltransferase